MGVLDKLMFWKDDETADAAYSEYEVSGCFTLPVDESSTSSVETPRPDGAEPKGDE